MIGKFAAPAHFGVQLLQSVTKTAGIANSARRSNRSSVKRLQWVPHIGRVDQGGWAVDHFAPQHRGAKAAARSLTCSRWSCVSMSAQLGPLRGLCASWPPFGEACRAEAHDRDQKARSRRATRRRRPEPGDDAGIRRPTRGGRISRLVDRDRRKATRSGVLQVGHVGRRPSNSKASSLRAPFSGAIPATERRGSHAGLPQSPTDPFDHRRFAGPSHSEIADANHWYASAARQEAPPVHSVNCATRQPSHREYWRPTALRRSKEARQPRRLPLTSSRNCVGPINRLSLIK